MIDAYYGICVSVDESEERPISHGEAFLERVTRDPKYWIAAALAPDSLMVDSVLYASSLSLLLWILDPLAAHLHPNTLSISSIRFSLELKKVFDHTSLHHIGLTKP